MTRHYFQISSGKIIITKKSSSNLFRVAKNKYDEWVIHHTNLKASDLAFEIDRNFQIYKNNLPTEKRKDARFLWKYSKDLENLLRELLKKHFLDYSSWIDHLFEDPK